MVNYGQHVNAVLMVEFDYVINAQGTICDAF